MDGPPTPPPRTRPLLLAAAAAAAALVALCGPAPVAGSTWGYKDPNGPDKWSGQCQTGKAQSPIDLVRNDATPVRLEPIIFFNFNEETPASAVNNGHTVEVRMLHPCKRAVASGGLPGVYELEQMHFHWHSEHTFHGKRWPLELHMVFRQDRYISIQKALQDKSGVAVIAILFHESNQRNYAMEIISDAVRKVSVSPSASQKLETPIRLQELLPKDTSTFYRYHGSLTTPGCNESVVWTVFDKPIPVTKQQMEAFQRVRGDDLSPLGNNYRPIQPLNGREVQLNSETHSSSSPTIIALQWLPLSALTIIVTTLHSQP